MTDNSINNGGLYSNEGEKQVTEGSFDMEIKDNMGASQSDAIVHMENESSTKDKKSRGGLYTAREAELIRQLVQARLERSEELEYEELDEYEMPPQTKFSMLKKPSLTIKFGYLKFNMACIHLFEGVRFIIPSLNRKKRRIAALMCLEEEGSSVEWARQKDGKWVNRDIRSDDYTEDVFELMKDWQRECRYRIPGRVTQSDRGLILVFDLEEGIGFEPNQEEYTDPISGEIKKRWVKYYPDFYKNRIGRYYNDYVAMRQLNMFEHLEEYSTGGMQDRKGLEGQDDSV